MKIIKFRLALTVITSVILVSFANQVSYAAGGVPPSVSMTAASVQADGSSTTTVNVQYFYYVCNDNNYGASVADCESSHTGFKETKLAINPGWIYTISVNNAGVALSKTTLTTSTDGYDSFTAKSTQIGTFTITVKNQYNVTQGTGSVTFTNPNPTTTNTPTTPTTETKTTAQQQTSTEQKEEKIKPTAPTFTLTGDDNMAIDAITDLPVYQQGERIVVSGKTVPNGEVTLYIHSDPLVVTTNADKDGVWTYEIANLEPGEHTIEIAVKDPVTGLSSDKTEVLGFSVVAHTAADEESVVTGQSDDASGINWLLPIGVLVAVLLAVGAGIWWWSRRRKLRSQSTADALPLDDTNATLSK